MREAMKALGVSRQTVLQRVKRGELDAVHVMRGKQKRTRIKAITPAIRTLRIEPHEPGGIMKRHTSSPREVRVYDFRVATKQQLFHLDHRLLGVSPRR